MRRLFFALCLLLILPGCSGEKPVYDDFFAMDTAMRLTLYEDGGVAAATEAEVNRLEASFSRTREGSFVSRLNRGESVEDEETAALLRRCRDYTALTEGAFDATVAPVVAAWGFTTDAYRVPGDAEIADLLTHVGAEGIDIAGNTVTLADGVGVDLGGIAKGYASDRVRSLWDAEGVACGIAALGGNVYCRGHKPDGSLWSVAVRDPADAEAFVGTLELADCFAVTSGGYERFFTQDGKTYHHIIDPATGYPAESGLLSVTVVTDASGTLADALSTALFIMGEEKSLAFLREHTEIGAVLVTDDARVLITEGLEPAFAPASEAYAYEYVR